MLTTEVIHGDLNVNGLNVDLRPPRLAQFVVIQRESTNDVMTICEVEVFEGGVLLKHYWSLIFDLHILLIGIEFPYSR